MLNRGDLPERRLETAESLRVERLSELRRVREIRAAQAAAVRGTSDARDLIRRAEAATIEAIAEYAAGTTKFTREFPVRTTRPRFKWGFISIGSVPVETDFWRYFRVRVLYNGNHPDATAEYVIAFEFGSDNIREDAESDKLPGEWLRDAIEQLMDRHGYERTLYVAEGGGRNDLIRFYPRPGVLAYSLAERP